MMRLIPVLLIFVLVACKSGPVTPKGILPPDKMEAVMWDLIRSGEFLNGYVLYKDTMTNRTAESLMWYDKVFAIHKISESEFKTSYAWYQQNPKVMAVVLDSMSKIPAPVVQTDTSVKTPAVTASPVTTAPLPVKNNTPDPRGLLQNRIGDRRPANSVRPNATPVRNDSARKRKRPGMIPVQ